MLIESRHLSFVLAAAPLLFCVPAGAQERPLTISPSRPVTTSAPTAGEVFTDSEGAWERVPAAMLLVRGPQYSEPSGMRIGRGSLVPDYVETAPMRNVSIRGLRPTAHYDYFGSPDRRVVVVNPTTRRVVRVRASFE